MIWIHFLNCTDFSSEHNWKPDLLKLLGKTGWQWLISTYRTVKWKWMVYSWTLYLKLESEIQTKNYFLKNTNITEGKNKSIILSVNTDYFIRTNISIMLKIIQWVCLKIIKKCFKFLNLRKKHIERKKHITKHF